MRFGYLLLSISERYGEKGGNLKVIEVDVLLIRIGFLGRSVRSMYYYLYTWSNGKKVLLFYSVIELSRSVDKTKIASLIQFSLWSPSIDSAYLIWANAFERRYFYSGNFNLFAAIIIKSKHILYGFAIYSSINVFSYSYINGFGGSNSPAFYSAVYNPVYSFLICYAVSPCMIVALIFSLSGRLP